jgi:penicillin-binding protein 1A
MNILAVKNMLTNSSIDTAFAYMENFGFTTLVDKGERADGRTDKVASLPLGGLTDGIYPVELAAAYGTIANGGKYNKPILYTKVLDHDGNILLENLPNPTPPQVIKDTTAYMLTDMMRDTVRIGTGTAVQFQEVNMPIAGKTGTSTDTKDLGFTGYTPYYVASIWMGYDHQKEITDDSRHKMLWRNIMEEVHRDLPTKDFERPGGIVSVSVCRDSGLLPTELCSRDERGSRVYTEIFALGTQPTTYCDIHTEVKICTRNGQRASYSCPEGETVMRVGIVRKVPPAETNPSGEAYTLDDRAYDLTSVINGPECEYHTQGIYYDADGNRQFDPNFSNQYGNYWSGVNEPQYPGMGEVFPGLQTPTPLPEFYIAPPSGESDRVPGLMTPVPAWQAQNSTLQNPIDQVFPPIVTP